MIIKVKHKDTEVIIDEQTKETAVRHRIDEIIKVIKEVVAQIKQLQN